MEFPEAAAFRMPFGKFRLKGLDQISRSDDGILYLDWLIGQDWVRAPLKPALEVFMQDPEVQRDLQEAMERAGGGGHE